MKPLDRKPNNRRNCERPGIFGGLHNGFMEADVMDKPLMTVLLLHGLFHFFEMACIIPKLFSSSLRVVSAAANPSNISGSHKA
jgi:hypothetical protein